MKTATLFMFKITTAQGIDRTICHTYKDAYAGRAAVLRDNPNCTIWDLETLDLQLVNIHEMQAGDRVFFGEALFVVNEAYSVARDERDLRNGYSDERGVAVRLATWVCGHSEVGYYGPHKGWTFQGNQRVTHWIAAR